MREIAFDVEEVEEGLASVLVPKLETYRLGPREYIPSRAPVFYNPLMKGNRDLAIAFLRKLRSDSGKGVLFGEPLTGTGVRGIRAVLEAGVEHAWINDLSKAATRVAEGNVRRNGVEERVTVEQLDANVFNLIHGSDFDYIDLDPFGSPSPFFESTMRALRDGGIVAVTATDAATLCGVYPEKATARYGGRSIKTVFPKEFAVRLLIYGIVGAAARTEAGAWPLLSHVSGHYVRVYCRLRRGNREASRAIGQTGHVLYCRRCFNREGLSRKAREMPEIACPICGGRRELAGPIWLGQHSDRPWVRSIIEAGEGLLERKAMEMLRKLSLEDTEILGSYPIPKISQYCHKSPPSRRRLLEGLRAVGIEAYESAFEGNAIKTAADINQILKLL